MKLAIISHTEHFKLNDGKIVGWGPTVREINELSRYFEIIIHLAPLICNNGEVISNSYTPYSSENIRFIPLIHAGGKGLINKLKVLKSIPNNLKTIHKSTKEVDWIQLRTPANLGIYVLPYLSFFTNKPRWVKYAGNWVEKNPPFTYLIQRWWLKKNYQNSKVTVNGKWPKSESHIIAFENPCLNNSDEALADSIVANKNFNTKLTLLFVGRIEDKKGIFRVMDAIAAIKTPNEIFNKIIIIGNGKDENKFLKIALNFPIKIEYVAGAARDDINKFYGQAHLFLLPSTASEGFPKVIAESARFGVIPVVSNVSSISQYVNSTNGFVWNIESEIDFISFFSKIPFADCQDLTHKSNAAKEIGKLFTYRKYYENLCKNIFNIQALPED
jgi:glycosyltransferase involved in cell wall biosynthesis